MKQISIAHFCAAVMVTILTCSAPAGAQDAQTSSEFTLTFENGHSRTFKSNVEACRMDRVDFAACVGYELVAHLPRTHAFVVFESYYEGGVYKLISSRTGNEVLLSTEPEYSPGLKRLVSVYGDESRYNDLGYDIAIWSVADPATLEWQYAAPPDRNELWNFIAWDGDDRIKLRVQGWDQVNKQAKENAELVLTPAGWQLNRPQN